MSNKCDIVRQTCIISKTQITGHCPARSDRTSFMDANQPVDQNLRILQVYNIYRLALAVLLLGSFLTGATTTQLGNHDPAVFLYTTLALTGFAVSVLFGVKPPLEIQERPRLLSALFIVDILCIALLNYASRGIISGLGLLHLVTIAAGSILIPGRISIFLAAIASLATIYGEIYLSFSRNVSANQYIQSGLLGALLFAAALYLQVLAERMRRSAVLAMQQASSILSLEQLNQTIIQRMRTGIVVVSPLGTIITSNDAADQMLSPADAERPSPVPTDAGAREIPVALLSLLTEWRQNKQKRLPTFRVHKNGPALQAHFAYLTPQIDSSILIFLEDSSHIIQRVRQMKLASLGRLTASIAHEIRNPLGAINHATQLLEESAQLGPADKRLLQIILTHSARVNLIIEDVLHMSRHKEDSTERINLLEWLTRYVATYRDSHSIEGDIRIEITPPTTEIRIITNQFEQILNNLVENGLRYSKQATGRQSILLRGGMLADDDNATPFLDVIDEGPGIDATTEEHLFEPFHTTEPTGTGLGLYISKELCEANQARLSYRRTATGKSCFSIHFTHTDRSID